MKSVPDNTPVIIGVATVSQHPDRLDGLRDSTIDEPATNKLAHKPASKPASKLASKLTLHESALSKTAEASQLMIQAAIQAGEDALNSGTTTPNATIPDVATPNVATPGADTPDGGTPDTAPASRILQKLDAVVAMASLSGYYNPALLVAKAVGAPEARTTRADAGILQQAMFSKICQEISQGELGLALIVSGEAGWRAQQYKIAGQKAPNTQDRTKANTPHEEISPDFIIHQDEITAGLTSAVSHYSLLENAYRHHHRQTKSQNSDETAALWERFSQIAQTNPQAWNRAGLRAADIATVSASNRMMAFPYAKRHCSQMNVDQSAALIFASVGRARELGVPQDRWIFPLGAAVSNHSVAVMQRSQPYFSHGFKVAGETVAQLCGHSPREADFLDLYSCFPVAVKLQADALGLSLNHQLTQTGGMPFAGGPFNSYVLHSLCEVVGKLREAPNAVGCVTSISGMVTKQGIGMFSTKPPPSPAQFVDVSDQVSQLDQPVPVDSQASGKAKVISFTVLHGATQKRDTREQDGNQTSTPAKGTTPTKGIAIAEFLQDFPVRRITHTTDTAVMDMMMSNDSPEFFATKINVAPDGTFTPLD